MKRIIFVDEDARCAGATVSLIYIVKRFVRDGYDVVVFTQKNEAYSAVYRDLGVTVVPYRIKGITNFCLGLYASSSRRMASVWKDGMKFVLGSLYFIRMFRPLHPDFIYVNEYVLPQALVAAAALRIPSGVHIRSSMISGSFGLRRRLVSKLVGRLAQVIVSITPIEGAQLALPPRYRQKLHVVGEFLDERNFSGPADIAECRRGRGWDTSLKYIVMIGGISSIKGTLEYLRAAESVLAHRSDVKFIVAGKAITDEAEYCQLCTGLLHTPLLQEGVVNVGEVADIPALLACADLVVSSNITSHFSRPVIEAWALKKPVVSSITAHSKELIDHGVNGILADVFDAPAFGRAMEQVVDDPVRAASLGMAGYKKASARFLADDNTRLIEEFVAASMNTSPVIA